MLCSGRIYRDLTNYLLKKSDLSTFGFIDLLDQHGFISLKSSMREGFKEMVSDESPFHESIHINIIVSLLKCMNPKFEDVVNRLNICKGFDSDYSYPYDLEDALLIWVNISLAHIGCDEIDDLSKELVNGYVLTCLLVMHKFANNDISQPSSHNNWNALMKILDLNNVVCVTGWAPDDSIESKSLIICMLACVYEICTPDLADGFQKKLKSSPTIFEVTTKTITFVEPMTTKSGSINVPKEDLILRNANTPKIIEINTETLSEPTISANIINEEEIAAKLEDQSDLQAWKKANNCIVLITAEAITPIQNTIIFKNKIELETESFEINLPGESNEIIATESDVVIGIDKNASSLGELAIQVAPDLITIHSESELYSDLVDSSLEGYNLELHPSINTPTEALHAETVNETYSVDLDNQLIEPLESSHDMIFHKTFPQHLHTEPPTIVGNHSDDSAIEDSPFSLQNMMATDLMRSFEYDTCSSDDIYDDEENDRLIQKSISMIESDDAYIQGHHGVTYDKGINLVDINGQSDHLFDPEVSNINSKLDSVNGENGRKFVGFSGEIIVDKEENKKFSVRPSTGFRTFPLPETEEEEDAAYFNHNEAAWKNAPKLSRSSSPIKLNYPPSDTYAGFTERIQVF